VYFASMEYQGVLDMVRDEVDTSYYTLRHLPADLVDAGKITLKAFNTCSRFFHLEYFRTPDGRLLALEANLRPPGGITIDMFNFASDVDLYQMWADVVTGSEAGHAIQRPYHCGYVGRKSYKRYVHSHEEIIARCGSLLVSHQQMDPVFHGAMGDYAYLVRSPNLEDVLELTAFIHKRG